MNLLFLDTETTGKDNSRCIQYAHIMCGKADRFDGGEQKQFLCKPPIPIEIGAMATHHITQAVADRQLPFSEFHDEVQKDLDSSIAIAHNMSFDKGVLEREGIVFKNPVICTRKLAERNFPDLESHSLQYLRYALDADRSEFHDLTAHDALSDVLVLTAVFEKILSKYENLAGMMLEKMILDSNTPFVLKMVKFGKHKGKTFEEVARWDARYLKWLQGAESEKPEGDRDANLLLTLSHHLA